MLELKHICKKFQERVILDDVSLKLPDYGFIGIQGESGCGKSTLLCILGMLDTHYEGEILYDGQPIEDYQNFICEHISFMMQNNDLIESLTVKENIVLSARVSQKKYTSQDLHRIVQRLGIEEYLLRYPHSLSGGQRKRVSLAKALLKQSDILLCDEPTGALHHQQSQEVMQLLKEVSKDCLVIVVSHDQHLLTKYSDALLIIENKKLKGKLPRFKKEHLISVNQKYSLWFYPFKQCLSQKKKLISLCLFQWLIIIAFFLIVTAFQGLNEAIHQSEIASVDFNQMTIENKDGMPFLSIPTLSYTQHINYQYHVEELDVSIHHQKINTNLSLLPDDMSHIQLQKGRLPNNQNEILVSATYQKDYQKVVHISYEGYEKDVRVVGVLQKDFFMQNCFYLHSSIIGELDILKDDYTLVVESLKQKNRSLYQRLSQDYYVYSDVIERVESYQSLLLFIKNVAYLFVIISFVISLFFIGIVESIVFTERKRDTAYLLSLGLKKYQLYTLAFVEAFFMAIMIGGGGGFFSLNVFYYLNHIFHLKQKIGFALVLKPIFFFQYDFIFLIICVYMMMVMIGILFPTYHASHVDVVEVMRGDSLC